MLVVQEIEREGIKAVRVNFENGKNFIFVNTTPHNITFKDPETDIEFVVPKSGILINAKPIEYPVVINQPIKFVLTKFIGNDEGKENIAHINELFTDGKISKEDIIIIGLIIAAQAYPQKVVAMTPHPDYIRVAPAEKRMNPHRFTIYLK